MHDSAAIVAAVFFEESEGTEDEFFASGEITEAELIDGVFVFEDGDIVDETFDLVEGPGLVGEVAVGEGVFEAVGGETRDIVVDDGEEAAVRNFAGEDAVTFELAHDAARVADDFAGAFFGGLLGFVVAVEKVDAMLEGGGGDIVEEGGKSLTFVMGKAPSDECDTDAVVEDGVGVSEIINAALVNATVGSNARKTLNFGGGDVLEEPSWEFGTKCVEILAHHGCELTEAALFGGKEIE